MKRYGIQIGNDGDIVVSKETHRMVTGDTLAQNEYLLLISQRGDLKQDPLMGAGIADMVGDNDTTSWKKRIRDSLKDDGIDVSRIEMTQEGKLTKLEADYD